MTTTATAEDVVSDVTIYCMKCKQHTRTKAIRLVTSEKGRVSTVGVCAVTECGSKKSRFGDAFKSAGVAPPANG